LVLPTYHRPGPDEYAPDYHRYVDLVPAGDVLVTLEQQGVESLDLWGLLPEARGDFRYPPGKWSVKEVVGHLLDTERVFALRALWFARGDAGPLPSMEQDAWVAAGRFDARRLAGLAEEYGVLRRATRLMLRSLDDAAIARRGVASGREITVRAYPWLIAGHERHHLRVLRERYLGA
jgi:hypothetical protein